MQGGFEGLFAAAFMTMSDAAFAADHRGKVVAGNAAFKSMFGIADVEEAGLSIDQLCIDAGTLDHLSALIAAAYGRALPRQRYRRCDGTVFWGERSDAPIFDGGEVCLGIVSIIRDVTEQAQLKEGLTSLLALPSLGSCQTDQAISDLISLGCQHFSVQHGSLGRIEGTDFVFQVVGGSPAFHYAGDKLALKDSFSSLPRDHDGLLMIEHCSRSDLASHSYCRRTGVETFLASEVRVAGRLYGALCFADDRPMQRRTQDHDRLLLRVMAQWIGMLLEGRMTRAALNVATQDLDRFAYIASHDLQEPLRRVVTYCQILMEDFGAEVSDEAAEVIEIIQTGGKLMRLMLNDLLVYSRLNQQLQRAFEPVDMASILCHAVDDLAVKLDETKANIDIDPLPLVWGRGPLLQMVCYHLLSNAIKFAGDQAPVIDISVQDQGRFWQFGFTDHGIGIEPRFADRIFDIFQRLHPKDHFQGSGAGLAICKLIVERHGGAIWLDTEYQRGARFLFTLPKGRWTAAPL